jgi:hypothetical protein
MRTVVGTARPARGAGPAAAVDLSNDALPFVHAAHRDADEFMSEDAVEVLIAAYQLQVGFADAGSKHTDEHVTRRLRRFGVIGPE